jgi:hypothetical protein
MKYYIGSVDPEGGADCVTDHGTHRRLEGSYHLVELAPSEGIRHGYEACLEIRSALENGTLASRTRSALNTWLKEQPSNKIVFQNTLIFLEGRTLEEAESRFHELYIQELSEQTAALAWVFTDSTPEVSGYLDPQVLLTLLRQAWLNTGPKAHSHKGINN